MRLILSLVVVYYPWYPLDMRRARMTSKMSRQSQESSFATSLWAEARVGEIQ